MRLVPIAAAILLVTIVTPAVAAEPPALAKARMRYNDGDYDGAISAAALARNQPASSDAAALVIARSHLELYRQRALPEDLTTARTTLQSIQASNLSSRDQVDLYIGLGQSLFLGEVFGPAAEMFDTALTRTGMLSSTERRQILDWWATALDREAQGRTAERRSRVFDRVLARMEEEVKEEPSNPIANYWLAVAARGVGDPDRAWDVAIAAWVRSSLSADSETMSLRADLDRLVGEALIPERARLRPTSEQEVAMTMLKAEWDLVKEQWK
jgi:hypothetical protein